MAVGTQIATSVTIINSLLGYNGVSLTDYTTSALTTIAAGSKLEIGGAFFHWATAETPVASSWTAIATAATAYLKCTPSGSAGTQVSTARWSSVTPVWSTSKQGWYASAASVARVVASAYKTSATQQDKKRLLTDPVVDIKRANAINAASTIHSDGVLSGSSLSVTGTASAGGVITAGGGVIAGTGNATLLKKIIDIGDWNMDSTTTLTVAHGLTNSKIRSIKVTIRGDDADNVFPLDAFMDGATTGGFYILQADPTYVTMVRVAGEFFDSGSFNSTSYNRGWIVIEYIP